MNSSKGWSAIGNWKSAALVFGCLLLAAAGSGCSATQVIRSDGTAQWSGLGARITLPQGTWHIRQSEKDQTATFFPQDRPGNLALFHLKSAPDTPDWLAFMRLFADFLDKKELSQGHIALPGGRSVEWAEYDVKTKDRTTRVKAYALRRDGWTYELAEWGFDRKPPGEEIVAGIEFPE